MRHNNRMKDVFDKMYKPDEDYGERLAKELQDCIPTFRAVAKGTQVAARLAITLFMLSICAVTLIISSCIKYLFFS